MILALWFQSDTCSFKKKSTALLWSLPSSRLVLHKIIFAYDHFMKKKVFLTDQDKIHLKEFKYYGQVWKKKIVFPY